MPAMINTPRAALALLCALTLTAAACNGDNNDDPTGGRTATPTSASGTPSTTITPDATAAASPGATTGPGNDFAATQQAFRTARFRAEYAFSAPPDDPFGSGTQVFYKDGEQRLRIDVRGEFEGQPVEIIAIDTPSLSGFCVSGAASDLSALLGIENVGDAACFETAEPGGLGVSGLREQFDRFLDANATVVEIQPRTVAGIQARCYTTSAGDPPGNDESCFNTDGVPLYIAGADGSLLQATTVATSVSDADFAFPYPVIDLPQ